MTLHRFTLSRTLVPIFVAASLMTVAVPVVSQTRAERPDAATWRQCRQERVRARLARMAKRLQITPAQQAAWAAYSNTVESLIGTKLARPATGADAAAITRFRAARATERAQKLSRLADATAALQQALDPQQQQTLGKMARPARRGMRHRGHHRYRH